MQIFKQNQQDSNRIFKAKLGKNITQTLRKEFEYNPVKLQKYEQLFQDTFKKNIDENTILDINKENKLMFSHTLFPRIKFCQNYKLPKNEPLGKSIINQCSRTIGNGEYNLFQLIISTSINNGKSFNKLFKLSEKLENDSSKKSFQNLLNIATRIKKENPKSKLTFNDFSSMQMKIMEEEMHTEGSELSNLIKNLGLSIQY